MENPNRQRSYFAEVHVQSDKTAWILCCGDKFKSGASYGKHYVSVHWYPPLVAAPGPSSQTGTPQPPVRNIPQTGCSPSAAYGGTGSTASKVSPTPSSPPTNPADNMTSPSNADNNVSHMPSSLPSNPADNMTSPSNAASNVWHMPSSPSSNLANNMMSPPSTAGFMSNALSDSPGFMNDLSLNHPMGDLFYQFTNDESDPQTTNSPSNNLN
ncbi:hypothetical protein Hte_004480 [Hypoxylon texense]